MERPAHGARPVAVWLIRNVASRLDRFVLRAFGGRIGIPSSRFVPTLVLRSRGRRTGKERATPLIYVVDDDSFIVANARPEGERTNPWILNLRASPEATVTVEGESTPVRAVELETPDMERWWPELVALWPAFADHFAATGDRTLFRLERAPARLEAAPS